MEELSNLDRTTLEIDLHLLDLWREIGEMDFPLDDEQVAVLLHAAYAFGYLDCLREEEPGELCRRFGWKVPGKTVPG